jgi:uncharacterized protein
MPGGSNLEIPPFKKFLLVPLLAAAGISALASPGAAPSGRAGPFAVFPDGHAFRIEIARTSQERAMGYMFRERVGPDEGMLFLFPVDDFHSFWMKNCRVSLDLIWLSEDRRVVYIEKGVPPCLKDPCPSFVPMRKARYVLEIASGGSNREGLKTGDLVQIQGVDLEAPVAP